MVADPEHPGKYWAVEYDGNEAKCLENNGRSEYAITCQERIAQAIHERTRRKQWR